MATTDLFRSPHSVATLAERRVAAGLNQSDVARALGVNRTAVSQWERGSRPVPARHLRIYDRLLRLDSEIASTSTDGPILGGGVKSAAQIVPRSSFAPDATGADFVFAWPAHLILSADLKIRDNQWPEFDDQSRSWTAYSPQGAEMNDSCAMDLERIREDAVIRLMRLGFRKFYTHYEHRVLIEDEPVCLVRMQANPFSESRFQQCRLLMSALIPDFFRADIGKDIAARAEIRSSFELAFPESVSGETLFIIAEPSDSYGWLQDQTMPYTPYTIVCRLPNGGRYFLGTVLHDHTSVEVEGRVVPLKDLNVQRHTTVAEIATLLEGADIDHELPLRI
ncbi:MAG: helix-turn-helix domain-containing protein [Mycolicibacterium sp.]|uniref:helix-turn-helix domain-containing protein n=1 Tax=Mycolicibacterium sp. TaxID=2320850 RepID=UPI003D0C2189